VNSPKKHIVVLAGTRPEVIKLAPVVQALQKHKALRTAVWLTGQHTVMASQMLEHFQLQADETFRISRQPGNITKLIAEVSRELARHLARLRPAMIVVQGDTTSAMLGAIAGFYEGIPVAHVEAGLRSFDLQQPFPEEFNRRVISIGAKLHFCPTKVSAANLLREGVDRKSIHVVGNTCIDALFWTLRRKHGRRIFPAGRRGILVTLHRRENWGDSIAGICRVLRKLASDFPDTEILLPVHRNPVVAETIRRELRGQERIHLAEPMDYASFCRAMKEAYLIVSDSGGVQEEALALGTPVLVTRSVTERPEVLRGGTVRLVGTSPAVLYDACVALLGNKRAYAKAHVARFPFGRGDASRKIATTVARTLR
jgi:UDP-N-acetylglucosamine 2-epimerase (non-hydrolysing)